MTNRDRQLILASQSPRRRQLLSDHGFKFQVMAPDESVEQQVQERGICSKCSPEELVLESAFVKAQAIACQVESGLILAADTVAECRAEILGKPVDREHAEKMLRLMMSGKTHRVLTGVCLWHRPSDKHSLHLEQTVLKMDRLTESELKTILDADGWIGKAGGFGYQDGLDWLHIESGLESNVVGLPVERLGSWIDSLIGQTSSES